MRFRPAAALDEARDDGLEPDLHDLARRVGRLVPCWQDPARFYRQRDDLADHLHRLARREGQEGRRRGLEPQPRASLVPTRERLLALARFQAREVDRLRALLAQACRPPPRSWRRPPDDRQLPLEF
jgi:hypothetical protein